MEKNIYEPIEATIENIITESPTIKSFVLRPSQDFSFQTGQFVDITVPGIGEAPFTPSSDPNIKDSLEVTIMNIGRVTSILHEAKPRDVLGLRGPYGKGYPLEDFKDKEILIVGGGVGLAPLRSLLLALFATIEEYKKVVFRYGAKTPADIIYKNLIPRWSKRHKKIDVVTTVDAGDKRWKGNVGLVTTILKNLPLNIKKAKAIVCGPPIMMKFVTFKLLDLGFAKDQIYLSMEKNMSCGLGKCGHCRIGPYYACKDGPVFTFDKIAHIHDIWD